jgi:FKBP-type peptidyl-prolyl cis-trans isomerase FklB
MKGSIVKVLSKFFTISSLACLSLSVLAQSSTALAQKAKVSKMNSEKDKVSYILGHQIGGNFKQNGIEVNTDILFQGLKEALAGTKSSLSDEESRSIMTAFQTKMQAKAEQGKKVDSEKNATEGKKFLEENGKKAGVITLPSGLQYRVMTEGKGDTPKSTDKVSVHYRGRLLSGKEFDSSYSRNAPAEFGVTQVIKGWTEALQLMKTGSKWEVYIPGSLAYGDRGAGGDIGPNATLIFEVELLSIVK